MLLEGLKMEDEDQLEGWSADAFAWQDMLNESGVVDLGMNWSMIGN
jgi:hypothetical protein